MTRVLLVDDDESNLLTLAAVLEDEGFEVAQAESVPAAEAALAGAPFDLAIVDHHIGEHLGTDLAVDIRRRSPSTKIVMLSGSLPERPKVVLDAFLEKGADLTRVLATLRELLP